MGDAKPDDRANFFRTGEPRIVIADGLATNMGEAALQEAYAVLGNRMEAFKYSPRVICPVREDVMNFSQDETVQIQNCPKEAVQGREYQRMAGFVGNIFAGQMFPERLLAVTDQTNHVLGSISAVVGSDSTCQYIYSDHREAMRRAKIRLFEPLTNEEITDYLDHLDAFFGPDGEFTKRTDIALPIQLIPIEFGQAVWKFAEAHKGDTQTLDAMYALIKKYPENMFLTVSVFEDAEDMKVLWSFSEQEPEKVQYLLGQFGKALEDIETVATEGRHVYEDPVAGYLHRSTKAFFRTIFHYCEHTDIDWDAIGLSLKGITDTLNGLYNIPLPDVLPKEQETFSKLSDYAVVHADEDAWLSLIAPVVNRYLELKLERLIPGEFETARAYFYKTIGEHLNAHASESTGDNEQQLSLQIKVFEELVRLGFWKKGYVLGDAGSGDGERVLRRYLDSPIMRQNPPERVYAIDADAYPQPEDGKWIAVQAKFEDKDFARIHAKAIGQDGIVPIDALIEMWSSPNDLNSVNQQVMFEHFAQLLRKRDGEVPGGVFVLEVPIGYIESMLEIANEHNRHEMGEAVLHYPVGEGKTLDKPLEIMLMHTLLIRAQAAGFRSLNLPQGKEIVQVPAIYKTGAGKDRAIIVFERVGDPEPTLDLARVQSGQAKLAASADARRRV